MEVIRVGSLVKWKHKPYLFNEFIAEGIVIKIFTSCVGGKRIPVKVAKIRPVMNDYWIRIGRKTTVVSLSKLKEMEGENEKPIEKV